ncbi:hypothetical protein BDV96DRAFT_643575 [Lophiotrema nucula]|uniref:BAH domain-containing protein n=1 Tax=Lophiotrema nucula TaxID=690887 RepID=A0A6A5ZFR7_9PLEO|nr:hypothetical protein BDV96DRAFT_643575 [Lophiotrema nucula]
MAKRKGDGDGNDLPAHGLPAPVSSGITSTRPTKKQKTGTQDSSETNANIYQSKTWFRLEKEGYWKGHFSVKRVARRHSVTDGPKLYTQKSPFKNKADGKDSLPTAYYEVDPSEYWDKFRPFEAFTMHRQHFKEGDYVYIKKDKATETESDATIQDWVAKILEIRAGGKKHVFILIYWMYRPEDLDGRAAVQHWTDKRSENLELEHEQHLFWRQTVNIPPNGVHKLHHISNLPTYCRCKYPYNPLEGSLIQCGHCNKWLHSRCLEQDAVRKAYKKTYPRDYSTIYQRDYTIVHQKGAWNIPASTARYTAKCTTDKAGKSRLVLREYHGDGKEDSESLVPLKCLSCYQDLILAEDEDEDEGQGASNTQGYSNDVSAHPAAASTTIPDTIAAPTKESSSSTQNLDSEQQVLDSDEEDADEGTDSGFESTPDDAADKMAGLTIKIPLFTPESELNLSVLLGIKSRAKHSPTPYPDA